MKKTFEQAKKLCISCCKNNNLKKITYKIFEQQEVINIFLKQEKKDEAYKAILGISKKYLKNKKGSILIPGSGTGGLSRKIAKQFPSAFIIQFDASSNMTKISKNKSKFFKNITTLQDNIDHYTKNTEKGIFSMIIIYGVLRYIDSKNRKNILEKLLGLLIPGGTLVIGEGGNPDITRDIPNIRNISQQKYVKTAKLFRCSLFYHLLDMYNRDDSFKHEVQLYSKQKNIRYTDTLEQIAGYKKDKEYIKVLIKEQSDYHKT